MGKIGWKQHSQNEIYAKHGRKHAVETQKDEVSSDWKVEASSSVMFRMNRI